MGDKERCEAGGCETDDRHAVIRQSRGPFDCRRLCRRRHWRGVLVITGSTARFVSAKEGAPIDASIVGIVDSIEIAENEKENFSEVDL